MADREKFVIPQQGTSSFSGDLRNIDAALTRWGYVEPTSPATPTEAPSALDVTETLRRYHQRWRGRGSREYNAISPDILDLLNDRKCGVPDVATGGGLQIQTYGAPEGRWTRGDLTYRVDSSKTSLRAELVQRIIEEAFGMWAAVTDFFVFTPTSGDADIEIAFGGAELNPNFGAPGSVAGVGYYPEQGRLYFDVGESWTSDFLLKIALHEIGHVLGLTHSEDRTSIMYPYVYATTLDPDTILGIRGLYGWEPARPLSDRGTSHGPSLAFADSQLHMAWKGVAGDGGIYCSQLEAASWSDQEKVEGCGSSTGPSLAEYRGNLIMLWKGIDGDSGIYWNERISGRWIGSTQIPNVGTSGRPAAVFFNGKLYLAWKGLEGDSGIYISTHRTSDGAAVWEPQQPVPGIGTSHSPSLAVFGDKLYMFWKGIEDDGRIFFSSLGSESGAIWDAQQEVFYLSTEKEGKTRILVGTSAAPAVAVRGDSIVMAWKGVSDDSGVWFSRFRNGEWSGQIKIDGAGTTSNPALAVVNGRLYLAWKGLSGDSEIYVSWLG